LSLKWHLKIDFLACSSTCFVKNVDTLASFI
jgi:hypothetical protein